MNDALETGLRHRLRRALRRMEQQHLHLRPLLAEVENAASDGARAPLHPPLLRFCDSLRAHFELEDSVLFPALHGLSPPSQKEIDRLSDEHGFFLSQLRGMLESTLACDAEAFARLRAALAEHERREEQLLESILGADALRRD